MSMDVLVLIFPTSLSFLSLRSLSPPSNLSVSICRCPRIRGWSLHGSVGVTGGRWSPACIWPLPARHPHAPHGSGLSSLRDRRPAQQDPCRRERARRRGKTGRRWLLISSPTSSLRDRRPAHSKKRREIPREGREMDVCLQACCSSASTCEASMRARFTQSAMLFIVCLLIFIATYMVYLERAKDLIPGIINQLNSLV